MIPQILRGALLSALALTYCGDLQAAAAGAPAPERTMLADPPRAIAEFQLVDHHGRSFTSQQLLGSPALVFFGFTHCPDVCPVTLQRLNFLLSKYPELHPVKVVMISVDGNRDTPEVLARYLTAFSPDFIGLTGKPESVATIARSFSAAFFKGAAGADGSYEVEHSSQVYLLDAQGRLRATFFNAPDQAMVTVIGSMRPQGNSADPSSALGAGS